MSRGTCRECGSGTFNASGLCSACTPKRTGVTAEVTKRCVKCGRGFRTGNKLTKYCSERCRQSTSWSKKRIDPHAHRARYGTEHAKARRLAAARHKPTDACARCGRPLGPMGPQLHYDHDEHGGYLGFSHAACNVSAGARKANLRRKYR